MIKLKNALSKLNFPLYFIIMAVVVEMISFALLGLGALPEYYMYDFAVILFVAAIIYVIPNTKVQFAISIVLLFLQCLICYVNYSLVTLYGDVLSIEMIRLFSDAMKAMDSGFTFIKIASLLVIIYIVEVAIGIGVYYLQKNTILAFKRNFSVIIAGFFIFMSGVGGLMFYQQRNKVYAESLEVDSTVSDQFLYENNFMKLLSLDKFGTFGFYLNDLVNSMTSHKEEEYLDAVNYFENQDIYSGDNNGLFGGDKGNNVLVIMMESQSWFNFGTQELTPNIYNIMHGFDASYYLDSNISDQYTDTAAFVSDHFFSKTKTNIAEGIGILGNYPATSSISSVVNAKNADYFDFSMPNIMNNLGYTSSYFHTNTKGFYNRDDLYPYIGFGDNLYFKDNQEVFADEDFGWGNWLSEERFVTEMIDNMIDADSPFYSFYLNVGTHGPYYDTENYDDQVMYKEFVLNSQWYADFRAKYQDSIDEETYNYIVNQTACVVGLDHAIGVIIKDLLQKGIYDETTIVLYGDHYAYYNNVANAVAQLPSTNYYDIGLNTVPLVIKSKTLQQNEIYSSDRFTSAYDIVPTLLDLLGIEFNCGVYVGNSLFSSNDRFESYIGPDGNIDYCNAYYSHTGGMYDKYASSQELTSFILDYDNEEYKNAFIRSCKKTLEKLYYAQFLYESDFYNDVIMKQ